MFKKLFFLCVLAFYTNLLNAKSLNSDSNMDEYLNIIHSMAVNGNVIEMDKATVAKTVIEDLEAAYKQCKVEAYPLVTVKLDHNFFKVYYNKGSQIYEIDVYPIDSKIKDLSKQAIIEALGPIKHEERKDGIDKIGYFAKENKLVFVLSEKTDKLLYYYVFNWRAHFNNMSDTPDNNRRW